MYPHLIIIWLVRKGNICKKTEVKFLYTCATANDTKSHSGLKIWFTHSNKKELNILKFLQINFFLVSCKIKCLFMLPFRNNLFNYTDSFSLLQQRQAKRNYALLLCLTCWELHTFPSFPLLPDQTKTCFNFRLSGFFTPNFHRRHLVSRLSRCGHLHRPVVLARRPSFSSSDYHDLPVPHCHHFWESSRLPHRYCLPPSLIRWLFSSVSYIPVTSGNVLLQQFFAKLSIPLLFSELVKVGRWSSSWRLPLPSNLSFFLSLWIMMHHLFLSFKKGISYFFIFLLFFLSKFVYASDSPSFFHLHTTWHPISINCTFHINKMFVINLLKTKRNLHYTRNQPVSRSKHFPPQL